MLHGWGQLGDGADVVGHTYWIPPKAAIDTSPAQPGCAMFKVELAEVKELEGMTFKNPTFEILNKTIKMIRGEE